MKKLFYLQKRRQKAMSLKYRRSRKTRKYFRPEFKGTGYCHTTCFEFRVKIIRGNRTALAKIYILMKNVVSIRHSMERIPSGDGHKNSCSSGNTKKHKAAREKIPLEFEFSKMFKKNISKKQNASAKKGLMLL